MNSYTYNRYLAWSINEKKIGGTFEDAHVKQYGDCPCLPGFWLPSQGGFSDLCALDDCNICQVTYYYASESGVYLHYEQYDEENNVHAEEWKTIAKIVNDPDPYPGWLTICPCCWNQIIGEEK